MKRLVKILGIVFGSILLVGVVGFILLYNFGLSGMRNNDEAKEGQLKVACVGDSVTYGHGIANWSKNNYPAQLGELLGEGYCVANFGVSGTTVQESGDKPYTSYDVYKDALSFDADILVFMIGSNDSKPENWKGIDVFKEEYIKLLNSFLKNNSDCKVYLCSIAYAYDDDEADSITNFDIQPKYVTEIAGFITAYAEEMNYGYIDVYSLTANNRAYISSDNVHPTKEGAYEIASLVKDKISVMPLE